MPRLQVTQVLSWLAGMILILTGSLIKWWFPCSVLLLCLKHQHAALFKEWGRMCSESQDTPGRKLVIVVSAGDVSTTQSKFLECGGSARKATQL